MPLSLSDSSESDSKPSSINAWLPINSEGSSGKSATKSSASSSASSQAARKAASNPSEGAIGELGRSKEAF